MKSLTRVAGLLALPLLVGGCLMSEQVGKPPEEVSFHYLSLFNVLMILVRLALVGVLARLTWTFVRDRPIPWPLLVPTAGLMLVVSSWALWGVFTIATWRIECGEEELNLHVPGKIWRTVPWEEVYGLGTDGMHTDYGGGAGGILAGGYTELEEAEILLSDRKVQLDLGRLSLEQRGNLAEIIFNRADMVDVPTDIYELYR